VAYNKKRNKPVISRNLIGQFYLNINGGSIKIVNLTCDSKIYTSNVYLITGTWNAISDVNTLIDVGRDPAVIEKINNASTGVGKHRIEQVIITHSHYDHTSLLSQIKKIFNPIVCAFSSSLEGVDIILQHKDNIKIGDRMFEVIHSPGHSSDSVCLYCEENGILFSGDTPIMIQSPVGSYEEDFVQALRTISRKHVRTVYCGHGPPLLNKCNDIILRSMKNVKMHIKKT